MIYINNNSVQCSFQKLNFIASALRNQTVSSAIMQLEFCRKQSSQYFYNIILSELHDIRINQNINLENLYIREVKIYKSFSLKRFITRARGKINQILKPYSKIGIIIEYRC